MNEYLSALGKYAVFSGRATRAEYWYFVLFNFLINLALVIIGYIIGDKSGALRGIYSLVVLIPALAVAVRRLHDIGKSGWMILISLIPLAGWIWLVVLLATDSSPEQNKYGPNPKGVATT